MASFYHAIIKRKQSALLNLAIYMVTWEFNACISNCWIIHAIFTLPKLIISNIFAAYKMMRILKCPITVRLFLIRCISTEIPADFHATRNFVWEITSIFLPFDKLHLIAVSLFIWLLHRICRAHSAVQCCSLHLSCVIVKATIKVFTCNYVVWICIKQIGQFHCIAWTRTLHSATRNAFWSITRTHGRFAYSMSESR